MLLLLRVSHHSVFSLLRLACRTLSALQFFSSPFTTLSSHSSSPSVIEEKEHSFYGSQAVWSLLSKISPETISKGQSVSHKKCSLASTSRSTGCGWSRQRGGRRVQEVDLRLLFLYAVHIQDHCHFRDVSLAEWSIVSGITNLHQSRGNQF